MSNESKSYSKNQFGEASISALLPIGGPLGPILRLPTGEYVFNGNGLPTQVAPEGSIYVRGDGIGINQILYFNTDGGTTWIAGNLTGGGGGGGTWGSITGTLSNQADLQTALNAKQATGDYLTGLTGDVTASGPGSAVATLADLAVTSGKIADLAVIAGKIAALAVTTAKLADLAVTTGKLADGAVTAAKITDATITGAKLADLAVATGKLADLAVSTIKLADASVTTAKLNDLSVATAKIIDLAVITAKIADLAVTTIKLADLSVTNAKIANATIDLAAKVTGLLSLANGGFNQSMAMQSTAALTSTALTPGVITLTYALGAVVHGIVAGSDGQFCYIIPTLATATLTHNNSAATAANRIQTATGTSWQVFAGTYAILVYSAAASRWLLVGVSKVNSVSSPLSLSTGGNISMTPAGSSLDGYLTSANWTTFNNKISGGTGVAERIAFWTGASTLSQIEHLSISVPKEGLGVGVAVADIGATVDSKSDLAQTIPAVSSAALNSTLFALPTSPTIVVAQTGRPDIQAPFVSASPTNLGSGAYSAGDVIDYIVTASDGTVWGVASTIFTGITDPSSSFDISVTLGPGTQNFTNAYYSLSRQVNGGGYVSYDREGTSFTDDNSRWTGGSDTLTPVADDFLANGTSYAGQIIAHGTKTTPIATTIVDPIGYDPSFTDDNTSVAYKMAVTVQGVGGNLPCRFEWPGTRTYETSTDFTSGPIGVTSSGSPVLSPTTYGILADGTHSFTATVYNRQASPSLYDATGTVAGTWTDPNDSNYYYHAISWTGGTGTAKVILDNPSEGKIQSPSPIYYDGVTSFGDGVGVTPTQYYQPALRASAHGASSDDPPASIIKSLDGNYARLEFQSSTDVAIGSIASTDDGVVYKQTAYTSYFPLLSSSVPIYSQFVDYSNGKLSYKDGSGTVHALY